MDTPHRVLFLVFPGVTLLDVAGPAEAFAAACRHGGDYTLEFVSPAGGAVRTSVGAVLDTSPVPDLEAEATRGPQHRIHTLVVAGGEELATQPLPRDLVRTVEELADRSDRVASVCTGAFALAEAGLLDGRRATTHWRHAALLARRHPRVAVRPDDLFVEDRGVLTSAGISSGIDLALAMIAADLGAESAHAVARELVVYMQRAGGQSQFSSALDWPAASSDPVRTVRDRVVSDPGAAHTVAGMAELAHVSPRHLTRLFMAELGTSPGKFLERVRVEAAKSLLDGGRTVTESAALAGFGTDENLRRAFVRHYGVTPGHYRGRFPVEAVQPA